MSDYIIRVYFFPNMLCLFVYNNNTIYFKKQVVPIKKIDSNVYLEPGIGAEETIVELPDLNMDDADRITQEIIDAFGSPSKIMRRGRGETPKKLPVKAYTNESKEKVDDLGKKVKEFHDIFLLKKNFRNVIF